MNYIYKSLDEGNYVFGVYIDLKKAFDTGQHQVLLYSCTILNTMEYMDSLFSGFNHTYPNKKQTTIYSNK